MKNRLEIHPEPLEKRGKVFIAIIVFGIILMWSFGIYAYLTLPQKIPGHFDLKGNPTRYDDKLSFLIITLILSGVSSGFLFITKWRFKLFNRSPYLLNLTWSFQQQIENIPHERKAFWLNRYFENLLIVDIFLTYSFLAMEYGMYISDISGKLPLWFIFFIFLFPLLIIILTLASFKKLSNLMKKETFT